MASVCGTATSNCAVRWLGTNPMERSQQVETSHLSKARYLGVRASYRSKQGCPCASRTMTLKISYALRVGLVPAIR
jgi:hypothetical protein